MIVVVAAAAVTAIALLHAAHRARTRKLAPRRIQRRR